MKLENWIGVSVSFLLLLLSIQKTIAIPLTFLEAIAVITSGWSVWLLSFNKPLGWWIGQIGAVAYIFVFYQAKLYGEIGLQVFFLVTGFQGIYIWLKGGKNQTEKPIEKVPKVIRLVSIFAVILGAIALRTILIAISGAAPFWDALTTVLSVVAQLYLMARYLESWYVWITVDIIYIPLYASRELYLTTLLYAIFLLLAIKGLRNFQSLYKMQQAQSKQENF